MGRCFCIDETRDAKILFPNKASRTFHYSWNLSFIKANSPLWFTGTYPVNHRELFFISHMLRLSRVLWIYTPKEPFIKRQYLQAVTKKLILCDKIQQHEKTRFDNRVSACRKSLPRGRLFHIYEVKWGRVRKMMEKGKMERGVVEVVDTESLVPQEHLLRRWTER